MKKLLLICLIVIIIVIAIAFGARSYEMNFVENNRKAMVEDLNEIANLALDYYEAPIEIGGGEKNWVPQINGEYQPNRCALWLIYAGEFVQESRDEFTNENGNYRLWVSSWEDKTLKMLGTGIEIGYDGFNPVKLRMELNGPTRGISIITLN